MPKIKKVRETLDEPWKAASEDMFPEYIDYAFPHIYEEIDWTVAPVFKDKELPSRLKGRRSKEVDKYVLVQLKNGEQRMLFIHIEFESHPRKGSTPERMFRYFYLLRELQPAKSQCPITAILMYVGDDVPAIYDRYDYEAFGTRLTYQFNTFRVREQDEEELRADPRPFALIILANLLMLKSKNDPEKRLSFKQHLYLLAAERKYSAAVTQSIITFAEEVMRLPDELELVFQDFVLNTSTSQNMSYVPQNTLNLADAIAKKHYGYTITEMEVSLSQKDEALSQKDEALSQKDETISQKDEALSQTIVRLFTQKKMNATEIADITGLDIADIHNTLSRYSL